MKRIGKNSLFPVLFFFIVSCAGTSPNILTVQAGPSGISSKQVEVNDSLLARWLYVEDVQVQPLSMGGSLEAQVLVKNLNDADVNFEYRFLWYDARGMELSTNTAWIPSALTGKETKGYKSVSPRSDAASFKFMMRMPHPLTES
jgi:uncharacterized protein YcfL